MLQSHIPHPHPSGKYEEAAQLYAAESGEEAKALYLNCLYQQAQQLYENGDLPGAAEAFHELGDYEDAASRSEECYNEYYGQVAQNAFEGVSDEINFRLTSADYLNFIPCNPNL